MYCNVHILKLSCGPLRLYVLQVCAALRALHLLWLLGDGTVVLWLILSQRRVRLYVQDRSTLYGSFQEEPPGSHQVTVALRVGEGVT